MAKTQNIFISHIHEDDAGLKKVKDLCRNHGLTVRDGSINKAKPNKAKYADYILNKIIGRFLPLNSLNVLRKTCSCNHS